MEVPFTAREVYSHTASVLRGLRLQRERAQFCDCVVRQRQSPTQLYPAHRCLLAASSPVLASILSCTGVLVELQAPCLTDFVLEFLLDYIYTGVLPSTCSPQTFSSLLRAACYLQMDELQEALDTWRQTETETEELTGSTCRKSNRNCANHFSIRDANPYISTVNYIQVTNVTPQDLLQHSCCTTEEQEEAQRRTNNPGAGPHQESREEEVMENTRNLCLPEELQEDEVQEEETQQLCLTVKNEAEYEQINRKDEDKGQTLRVLCVGSRASPSLSFSSSSSPLGASVPVICHSSTAACLVHPTIIQTSDYDSSQTQGHRDRDESAALSWDNKDHSGQCVIQDSCRSAAQSVFQQDHSSAVDHFMAQDDEDKGDGSSHVTHHPDNKGKRHRVNSLLLNWKDFTSTHQPMEHSDKHSEVSSVAEKYSSYHRPGPRTVFPLPLDKGSDYFSEDHTDSDWRTDRADRQDGHRNFPLNTSSFTNSHRAKRRTEDIDLWPREDDTDGVCLPVSASGHQASHEKVKISSGELIETHIVPANKSRVNPEDNEGQSYSGHIHYHCLSQDTYANTDHTGHFSPHTDPSSEEEEEEEEEARTFTTGTTDQVLLLNISDKPEKLLVSYRHRGGDEVDTQETNRTTVWKNDGKTSETVIEDGGRAGAEALKTLTPVCSPPVVSGSAHTSRLPTWSIAAALSGSAHQLFQCSLCDRSFSQRGSLNRHVRSHLGVRPFPCPRCPMTFSRQYRVMEHMRVHERCTMDPVLQKHPDT